MSCPASCGLRSCWRRVVHRAGLPVCALPARSHPSSGSKSWEVAQCHECSWPQERSPGRGAAGRCSRVHKNGCFMSRTASASSLPRRAGPWMGEEGQKLLLAPFFGGGAAWRDGRGEAGAEGMPPGLSTLPRRAMPLTVSAPRETVFSWQTEVFAGPHRGEEGAVEPCPSFHPGSW